MAHGHAAGPTQTAQQIVAQMPAHPDLSSSRNHAERSSGESQLGTPERANARNALTSGQAEDDLVAQRARLRRLLQEHTNLNPKQIDKIFKGVDKDIKSITKAIEDKYGKEENIPPELLREIVDLIKSYIKNLEEITKGFADVLKASAAR